MADDTAATGDKGCVPVSVEESRAGSTPPTRSAHARGWILRRTESFSGATWGTEGEVLAPELDRYSASDEPALTPFVSKAS